MLIRIPDKLNYNQIERIFDCLKLEGFTPYFRGCGDGTVMVWCDSVEEGWKIVWNKNQ